MQCTFEIEGKDYSFELGGEFEWGKDEVLFDEKTSLIRNTNWKDTGYTCAEVLDENEWETLQTDFHRILSDIFAEQNLICPADFSLENYHHFVQNRHQQVIEKTRQLTRSDFTLNWQPLVEKVSELLQIPLTFYNPRLPQEIITLRINRPNSLDINPLHRDGYLDFYKNTVNLWLPIAGCDSTNSLPVLPGSHFWNEKNLLRTSSATINGLTYRVPGVVQATQPLRLVRPNPQPRQALVFTPFLLHGVAFNRRPHTTRMALELRLCPL
jgi:hypothetical protein